MVEVTVTIDVILGCLHPPKTTQKTATRRTLLGERPSDGGKPNALGASVLRPWGEYNPEESFSHAAAIRLVPVDASLFQPLEMTEHHLLLVWRETHGNHKTQQDRSGDQPEQLHQSHILVSSYCSYCITIVLHLFIVPKIL